jgi:hypothetical protein
MNTCCSGRSSRPTGLFSFSFLDGPEESRCPGPAGSPTRRRAQTWRSLFIAPCAAREVHWKGHVLARPRSAGAIERFGLSHFATASINNPG